MSDKKQDLTHLAPYGDAFGDGKVQLSFTLPIPNDARGAEAAKILLQDMGFENIDITHKESLDSDFTFYVAYGSTKNFVDYTAIEAIDETPEAMSMEEIEDYIAKNIKRDVVIVGASTGSDAHTVGIDAIMNMKGYAGHFGLERYKGIKAINMGSQVPNSELIEKVKEVKADAVLISQTVTQRDIHIKNLTELVEMFEAEGIRSDIVLICGGARVSNELAKELGYDAGFGPQKYATDVATFIVEQMIDRNLV